MNVKSLLVCGILAMVIAASATSIVFGQRKHSTLSTPPCSLTLGESPDIRGLRLGMSLEEFKRLFPNVRRPPLKDNGAFGQVTYDVEEAGTVFGDVWVTQTVFVDNRLSYLAIVYPDFEPENAADFVRQAAVKLSLPEVGWRRESPSTRILACKEFQVYLDTGDHGFKKNFPAVILEDTVAKALVARRKTELIRREQQRRKAEQQRRRVFTP